MRSPCRWVVCAFGLWTGTWAAAAWSEDVQVQEQQQLQAAPQRKVNPLENCRCHGHDGPAADRIRTVLMEPLKSSGLEFTEEPLENVVDFLQDEYQIPILFDVPALEDAGLTVDEKMSVNLQNISLKSALRLMLKTKQLTYVICDEVLMITTPEEAEANLIACVYDVRDIIATSKGKKDFDAMIDMIVNCVAAETWAENGGGEAEIRPLQPGLLVISQTQAVHDEIRELLSLIRESLEQPVHAQQETGKFQDDPFSSAMGMEGGMGAGYGGEMGGRGAAEPNPFE